MQRPTSITGSEWIRRVGIRLALGALWLLGARAEDIELYSREVRPLLEQRCYPCHSRLKQKGELRLDAGVLIHKGGRHGSIVQLQPDGILPLLDRVGSTDPEHRMPPEGRALSGDEIATLRRWIDSGATFPKSEPVPIAPGDHWAFQPVRRPLLPTVRAAHWPRTPIDTFLLSRWEKQGWTPGPRANDSALLRRVHLDLTGLPPTQSEQQAIVAVPGDAALDRVVDQLLARPTYGERWARHWLDVVRYADSNGYERDAEKPLVWKYRDYVIRALNRDTPFNRFVLEQLAGDELPDASTETVLATGYARLGNWDDEPADPETDRYDQLDDIVSTTSQAFLGLTLGCARCHDHKFEPLTTKDYYSMVAVFAPLSRPQNGRTELTRPAGPRSLVEESLWLKRVLAEVEKSDASPQSIDRIFPKARLEEVRAQLEDGYFLFESSPTPPVSHVLLRGNPGRKGDRVEPATPAVLTRHTLRAPTADRWTTGRRLALAQWIAHADNPLTARVIVNRVWQQHFGTGLVRTPNDFGTMGEPPTDPELLDWLTDWFTHEGGWSLKSLHRLILQSQAWRLSREVQPDHAVVDPDNRLFSRQGYRRLEVEPLRDSILAVSGQLNPAMGGRGVFLPIPRAAIEANTDRDSIWPAVSDAEAARRTVYAFVKRGLVVPLLEVLDLCDTVSSSPRRQVTTIAPQALTLFNGDFVNQQARRLADRLRQEAGDDRGRQVTLAYRLSLCRTPTEKELMAARAFFETFPGEHEQALSEFCRVLFNLNEFAYPE